MSLMRLIYVSRPATARPLEAFQRTCDAILETSRRNNARDGITGVLAASPDLFVQVLEGAPEAVSDAFLRIARDGRHGVLRLVEAAAVSGRRFGCWGMAYADIEMLPSALRAPVTRGGRIDCEALDPEALLAFLEGAVHHEAADHSLLGLAPTREPPIDDDIVFV